MRQMLMTFTVAALIMAAPRFPIHAADDPLAFVPSNTSFFAHLRVAELLNEPLVQGVRFFGKKDIEKPVAELKKEVGIDLDNVDTATFFFPNMPQGPGDEKTFVVVVTTLKPYDKNALMQSLRSNDAKESDNLLKLKDKFTLYTPSPTMFVVMYDSLVDKIVKEPRMAKPPGVASEALQRVRDKHQFVFSIDFSKLPNEIFTAAPPELQPFLPILKCKTSCLCADLKKAQLDASVAFVAEDAGAAEDAENSFKLLMKLASDGINEVQKQSDRNREVKAAVPLLKELDQSLKNLKLTRQGERVEASANLRVDQAIVGIVAEGLKNMQSGAARAQDSNNLKQIGLAIHNYHDVHSGLPPAAICDKKGRPLLSWRVAILPFIEQNELYQQFKLDEPWDSEHNKKLIAKMPKTYALPQTAPAEGKTPYRVFYGRDAAFDLFQPITLLQITDGTSNTVMAVESAEPVVWSKPDDFEFNEKLNIENLLRFDNGRTTVVFCDGSVRSLRKGIDAKVWRNLVQRNDGEIIHDLEK